MSQGREKRRISSSLQYFAWRRDHHPRDSLLPQQIGEYPLRLRVTVDQRDLLEITAVTDRHGIADEVLLIGVGAKAVQDKNLGLPCYLDTKDLDLRTSLYQTTPQGMGRLVAHDQDGVLRVPDHSRATPWRAVPGRGASSQ